MASATRLEEWLTWSLSPSISAIIVTLIISFSLPALIHLYLYHKAAAQEPPTYLLAGPSGSGKTSLLTLFSTGTAAPTYTSQTPTTTLCHLPPTTRPRTDRYRSAHDDAPPTQPALRLQDTPGHGKLRHHALDTLLTSSSSSSPPRPLRGLVFVVDSAALAAPAALADAADFLHDLLLALQRRHTRNSSSKGPAAIPVLVAANKQDIFTALPVGQVRARLEAEIGLVRVARSRRLADSGRGGMEGEGEDQEEDEEGWLGEFGSRDFSFAQMEESGVEVSVLGGNVKGEEGDDGARVQEWWDWIGRNM